VYLAEDTWLGRKVALKILSAEFANDENQVRRFKQEARAAAALNHPNILTIYEVGQAGTVHFMVMEFVEGEMLRQIIARERIPLHKALDMAIQVATALAAAHAAGVVHRDIKPENIIRRPDGFVKVLDFGLAKLIERRRPSGERVSPKFTIVDTDPGVVMGTVNYMSPEQARGLVVDARTDIFSLGVVLYEMLTGRVPFEGPTKSDVIVSILEREPIPLSRYDAHIPSELEHIVTKAVAKDREERYQTVKNLLIDLKWLKKRLEFEVELERHQQQASRTAEEPVSREAGEPRSRGAVVSRPPVVVGGETMTNDQRPTPLPQPSAVTARRRPSTAKRSKRLAMSNKKVVALVVGVLVLALAGGVAYFWWGEAITSVAVLRFVNGNGNASTEYLSDGLTRSLINDLSQTPNLKVISWDSVIHYRGGVDPETVAHGLGVQSLLTGRVSQTVDTLSVNLRLIAADGGDELWSRDIERGRTDILAVQNEITQAVVEALGLTLSDELQRRLAKRYTGSTEAYQLYLKGYYYLSQGSKEGWDKSVEHFTKAVERDPAFALMHVGLADAYYQASNVYLPGHAAIPKAVASATRAVALDSQLAEAHIVLASIRFWRDWNWAEAEREFKQALTLAPGSALAHDGYGSYLITVKRFDEARAMFERAQELDPHSRGIKLHVGWPLLFARQYDQAIDHYKEMVREDPNSFSARLWLGYAYELGGKHIDAISEFAKLAPPEKVGILEDAFTTGGWSGFWRKQLQDWEENSLPSFLVAQGYALIGDKEKAFVWLEKAYQERVDLLVWLNVDPGFDSLRPDPRFESLVQRVGLR
jgi:serine/threonine-protein kinase